MATDATVQPAADLFRGRHRATARLVHVKLQTSEYGVTRRGEFRLDDVGQRLYGNVTQAFDDALDAALDIERELHERTLDRLWAGSPDDQAAAASAQPPVLRSLVGTTFTFDARFKRGSHVLFFTRPTKVSVKITGSDTHE